MLTTLLKYRIRIQRLFHFSEDHTMLLWAGVVGLVGALATISFRESIHAVQWLLTGKTGSLVGIAESLPWYVRLIMPPLGGLVAGVFLVLSKRFASGAASDYMEAVAIGDGHISVRQSLLRSVSSLGTITTGGSIGREGSMVQLAAMAASFIGRITHFDPPRLRLLVACGAAAGLTSAYNAPIAGAFFVTEIVLGSIAMESFGPLLVASVVANITMREFPGYQPTYEMPPFPAIFGWEVIFFVGLGILCGFASPQYLRLLAFVKRKLKETNFPLPARLALGGLFVGLISVWEPQVWGNGYSVVNSMLHSPWAWTAVLSVLLFKVLATSFTMGSGAIGGVFTPTLFVGASIGYLVGFGVHALFPVGTSQPYAYAIVGMGAFLAAATSAPLMAILMIFEMTLSYQVVLPLMLACVVGYFVARSIDETSMYEITIKRNEDAKARLRLRSTQMRELIKPADTVLPLSASFEELSKMFLEYPVKYIYIVDDENRYQGVVSLQDVTSALLEKSDMSAKRAADFLRRDALPVITPGMSLGQALQHFLGHQGERLPTVDETGETRALLGVVYKSSLLDAYFKLNKAGG
ncbi:voltage-gated chloride channel [Pandoraea thiooxydans]|uniref:Voltage-gated chloride channel protein ClcB n=1 Tax=Pandoraea thiooxydans TaxID=445709 RepID=A0A0G3ERM0_9BURK|nr:ClcB-like voltage-gated chloride channel protein [Pandoraea thiooxydans]AKJ67942.1 voltage-gated chloride channel protein ClcB [Pandoraea thiooxydans]APR95153.1 voltage-gated chloride channel [Pandoraea thiooxydans]